jgi:glutaredoxin
MHMVRGLANVPAPYRDKAVVLGRENVNLVDVPTSMAVAFRDWQQDPNPNRHDVVLWSAPWCGACKNAIRYLDERGIRYEERDIDSDRSAREELVRIVGRIAVPLLQIDGRYVSGYRRDVYDRLMP